jgi:UDP-GlcNAc:undecaprenyl-phosphate/decaprenyl-phosphate GlcNAc-1-phosphate transferase
MVTATGGSASALVSFFVTLAVIGMLRVATRNSRAFVDSPNSRSLHAGHVPRIGGLGMLAGIAAAALSWTIGSTSWATPPLLALAGAGLLLVCIGAIDDARGLSAPIRLAIHAAAAAVLLTPLNLPLPLALALGALCVLATNLFNFMDGSDGLAGGMALAGFGSLALALSPISLPGSPSPAHALTLLCVAIAAAAAGFLTFNIPPARVFMGDAGSTTLGFLAVGIGIVAHHNTLLPWWFVPAAFAPFWVDALTTLLWRALRGQKVWQAHREHAYQRLVLAGMSKPQLLAIALALMLASCAGALAVLKTGADPLWLAVAHAVFWPPALLAARRRPALS